MLQNSFILCCWTHGLRWRWLWAHVWCVEWRLLVGWTKSWIKAFEVFHILGSWSSFYLNWILMQTAARMGARWCCVHANRIRLLWSLVLMAGWLLICWRIKVGTARKNVFIFSLNLKGDTWTGENRNSAGLVCHPSKQTRRGQML